MAYINWNPPSNKGPTRYFAGQHTETEEQFQTRRKLVWMHRAHRLLVLLTISVLGNLAFLVHLITRHHR